MQIRDYIYEKSQVVLLIYHYFYWFILLGKDREFALKDLGRLKNLGQSYGVQNFWLVTLKT
jgi:hypothetical protein